MYTNQCKKRKFKHPKLINFTHCRLVDHVWAVFRIVFLLIRWIWNMFYEYCQVCTSQWTNVHLCTVNQFDGVVFIDTVPENRQKETASLFLQTKYESWWYAQCTKSGHVLCDSNREIDMQPNRIIISLLLHPVACMRRTNWT